jgi:predicted ribosomally synthesized peptide with nif11-like leader
MSQNDFQQFRARVLNDPLLQRRFMGLDSSEEFTALVTEAGAELGFAFTAEDVAEAMRVEHSEWITRWI